MKILSRLFTVVPLSEIVERLARGASIERLAAVTFDDGYADTYRYAFPILKSLEIPATVFLATDFVEQCLSFWWDRLAWTVTRKAGGPWALPSELGGPVTLGSREEVRAVHSRLSMKLRTMRQATRTECLRDLGVEDLNLANTGPLTWSEIQTMLGQGISFGAHSCSHPSLPELSDADVREEIEGSRDCLLARLGSGASNLFAYPYGDVDERVAQMARDAGFVGAAAVEDCLCTNSSSLFLIPRLMVRDWHGYFFKKQLDALGQGGFIRGPDMLVRQTIKNMLPRPVLRAVRWMARRRYSAG